MSENLEPPIAGPSLDDLLDRLDFLKDHWFEVGEALRISGQTLNELQGSPEANNTPPEDNLEAVIVEWIEENQVRVLLPQIVETLRDSQFVQSNPSILRKLNNLTSRRPNRRKNIPRRREESMEREPEKTSCCHTFRRCLPSCGILCCLTQLLVVAFAIWMAKNVGTYSEELDELDKILMENKEMDETLLQIGVREIRLLITGKTGTGKSALINGIIRENVTEEGGALDPQTTEVEAFKRTLQGIPITVFDSPGLQDGTENEKQYLLDMERKCKKVDLVLYTLKMTDKRLHADDVEAMRKLTNAFGAQFWRHAMFAMTFANDVRDPEKPEDDERNSKFFEERLDKWKTKLPQTLEKELNVTRKVAKQVPVVPAGYHKHQHLPGRRYWFSEFFKAVLNRMKECNKDGYMLMLRFNKDRFRRVYEVTEEDLQRELHKQPIVISSASSKKSSAAATSSGRSAIFLAVWSILAPLTYYNIIV